VFVFFFFQFTQLESTSKTEVILEVTLKTTSGAQLGQPWKRLP